MKKMLLLFCTLTCITVVNAQTGDRQKLSGLDSLKTLPDFSTPFKTLPPLGQLKPQEYKLQLPKNYNLQAPVGTIAPLEQLTALDHMPVAKPHPTDNMPVLKLGDTETTHFTMLIAPVAGFPDKNKKTTP